jgi:hypothetical protein
MTAKSRTLPQEAKKPHMQAVKTQFRASRWASLCLLGIACEMSSPLNRSTESQPQRPILTTTPVSATGNPDVDSKAFYNAPLVAVNNLGIEAIIDKMLPIPVQLKGADLPVYVVDVLYCGGSPDTQNGRLLALVSLEPHAATTQVLKREDCERATGGPHDDAGNSNSDLLAFFDVVPRSSGVDLALQFRRAILPVDDGVAPDLALPDAYLGPLLIPDLVFWWHPKAISFLDEHIEIAFGNYGREGFPDYESSPTVATRCRSELASDPSAVYGPEPSFVNPLGRIRNRVRQTTVSGPEMLDIRLDLYDSPRLGVTISVPYLSYLVNNVVYWNAPTGKIDSGIIHASPQLFAASVSPAPRLGNRIFESPDLEISTLIGFPIQDRTDPDNGGQDDCLFTLNAILPLTHSYSDNRMYYGSAEIDRPVVTCTGSVCALADAMQSTIDRALDATKRRSSPLKGKRVVRDGEIGPIRVSYAGRDATIHVVGAGEAVYPDNGTEWLGLAFELR